MNAPNTADKQAFAIGDLVECTLEGSSMEGHQGKITGSYSFVPSGGWKGYPTDIKHPERIGDGFGWFKPGCLKLIDAIRPVFDVSRIISWQLRYNPTRDEKVWYSDSDPMRQLCNSGVRRYLDLPDECDQFDAIISVVEPVSGGFKIQENANGMGFDTDAQIRYYAGFKYLLSELYSNGFRYVRVEY